MYAVIKSGGKQYRVNEGDVLTVEKIEGDAGQEVKFHEVLFLFSEDKLFVGNPLIQNASVSAQILNQMKDDKIIVFKMKRRKNYRRKSGHRQCLTKVKVTTINFETV